MSARDDYPLHRALEMLNGGPSALDEIDRLREMVPGSWDKCRDDLEHHIAKLEAQFDLLEAELTEVKWLRAEETDDLRKTIVMLWDVMRDDDCIRFSSISPVRYNTVNDLWQTWNKAQRERP